MKVYFVIVFSLVSSFMCLFVRINVLHKLLILIFTQAKHFLYKMTKFINIGSTSFMMHRNLTNKFDKMRASHIKIRCIKAYRNTGQTKIAMAVYHNYTIVQHYLISDLLTKHMSVKETQYK
jgi:hypothetical protein